VFPEKLKSSRVVPIYKAGDRSSCDNYRPIWLVSSISKILEKIVANRLVDHLVSNELLYEHQYGFSKGRSTEHNLLHLVNTIGQAINEDKFCIGIFLDLKKAFDVVPHNILIKKLSKLGINGTPLNWFKSYLANRTQKSRNKWPPF
jgi:methylaspartate ammonia-lyase